MIGNFLNKIRKDADVMSEASLMLSSMVIACVAFVMSMINIFTKAGVMTYIMGAVCAWFTISVVMFFFTKSRWQLLLCMLCAAYVLMMYFVISGGVDGFSIVWLLVIPPAAMYCFRLFYGGVFSIILGISLIVYMWTPLYNLGYAYSEVYKLRFPLVYLFVTFLCFIIQYRVFVASEKQQELIEKLEHANRTKGDFLANMSHEIRTPMNSIIGMCELIMRDDINDSVRENCYNIQNSGRNLLAIINDILDFSKIESGKTEIIEEEFNISSTINDVINMAITRMGDKNVDFIVRVDPNIPAGLVGDEIRIRQVIINLVNNAVKFTNEGYIVLEITQAVTETGIDLKVAVIDTGVGIAKEDMNKLFTSFQQVDTRKNRAVEGTGLGLAISKGLVSRMGGSINVSSVYGEGSEFSFVIPLKVSDGSAFVHINNVETFNIGVCMDSKYYTNPKKEEEYTKLMSGMCKGFNIKCKKYRTIAELRQAVDEGLHTHCFIPQNIYVDDKETIISMSESVKVIVVQDKFNAISLPDNIKCIFKPFYALSVAAALNNEKHVVDLGEKKKTSPHFIAPEAKVLLVDDNLINLKVAEGLMKPYRMNVVSVESGRAAIEKLKTKDYDLVFMDHMMPQMDGVEAFGIIRNMEDEYYKKVPVIMLTANAIDGVRDTFLKCGFNDYMSKPIEITMLDRVLNTWLPSHKIVMLDEK